MSPPRQLPYICRSCLHHFHTRQTGRRSFSTTPHAPNNVAASTILPLPPSIPPESQIFKLSSSRRLIYISGPDAVTYLHGATTNNVPDTKSTEGLYSAFLTAQGRVLFDSFIYPTNHCKSGGFIPPPSTSGRGGDSLDPSYLIDVHSSQAEDLVKHLRRYKLRSKFSIRILEREEAAVWSVPISFATGDGEVNENGKIGCIDPRAPGMGRRLVLPAGTSLYTSSSSQQQEEMTEQTYKLKRYILGVPENPLEIIPGTSLPQESNLDYMSAINFHKGCYVGQELTIRTHHRGVVRKRVLPVMLYTDSYGSVGGTEQLAYDPSFGQKLQEVLLPSGANITRVGKKGRSVGKFLGNVGNIGLALCRLEIMTALQFGESATTTARDSDFSNSDVAADEFKIEIEGDGGEVKGAQIGGEDVKVKAFVPEWHSTGTITNETA